MGAALRIAEQLLLAGSLALPALALLYKPRLFPRLRTRWLFLACCVAVYVTILAQVWLIDLRLERELMAFDLDGNGWFTPEEESPAQQLAMQRVISDAARQLAPFTGLILSPLLVALAFAAAALLKRTRHAFARRSTGTF
jgi:hypothetical protein